LVGETIQDDVTHCLPIPDVNDLRWIDGMLNVLDVDVLTLSHFYPSGKLGACIERKSSIPPIMAVNHPAFTGCVKWMLIDML
jgi:hypothetical protein